MSLLSDNIKQRMWDLGMTQDELAKKMGYQSRSSINNIVNGAVDVSYSKIPDFARALKTTPAALCGYDIDDETDGKNEYNLQVLAKRLRKNEFNTIIINTLEEASDYIIKNCAGKSVGIGDGTVAKNLGIRNKLEQIYHDGIYPLDLSTDSPKGRENRKKAMNANIFVLSVDGISYQTGEMVVLDHKEGKIAGSLCADEIIFVIGKNKISPDLEKAIHRARNIVSVDKAKSHGFTTPCGESGICEDCDSPERFCRIMCTYFRKPKMINATVILVNEELGA